MNRSRASIGIRCLWGTRASTIWFRERSSSSLPRLLSLPTTTNTTTTTTLPCPLPFVPCRRCTARRRPGRCTALSLFFLPIVLHVCDLASPLSLVPFLVVRTQVHHPFSSFRSLSPSFSSGGCHSRWSTAAQNGFHNGPLVPIHATHTRSSDRPSSRPATSGCCTGCRSRGRRRLGRRGEACPSSALQLLGVRPRFG